jgi:hypothetical protein
LIECVRAKATHPIETKNKNMKTKSLIVIVASFGLIGAAHAEEGKDRPQRKLPPELMEKIDTDKDGKISPEEREAAKKMREGMMGKHRKEMLEKFDKDGDGKLNDEEEAAMREERKKMVIEKFDKDGDGELNDEEKAEMRKAMMELPRRPDGKRRGPGDGERKRDRPQGGGDKEAPGAGE